MVLNTINAMFRTFRICVPVTSLRPLRLTIRPAGRISPAICPGETDLSKISWSTLLLFGGGLSLGSAVNQVGIDSLLAILVQGWITGIPLFVTLLILVFFGILVTMVASNTASAAILIPLMLPLSGGLGIDMKSIALLIAIGVSLDFMMPVGTPPSAIAYSTGVVNVREMIKNGFMVNIGTGLILVVLYYFFYL